jgi:hypothetical protein
VIDLPDETDSLPTCAVFQDKAAALAALKEAGLKYDVYEQAETDLRNKATAQCDIALTTAQLKELFGRVISPKAGVIENSEEFKARLESVR